MANRQRRDILLIVLSLVVATFVVYWPAGHFPFVTFDDPQYVYENDWVTSGLTWSSVRWAFTSSYAGNWHPLTWISHMVDWQLYGANAGGHHITNVIVHIAAAIILFLAMNRLTASVWRSGFVAALFALHPVHVESVAWVSERKDDLCAFFGMATIFFYAGYAKKRDAGQTSAVNYVAAVISFGLSLMAKQMLVTMPFVLLLLDIWPLNGFRGSNGRIRPNVLLDKVPFLLITVILSVIALYAQKLDQAVASLDMVPLDRRLENVVVSYFRYSTKLFWPTNLSVFYPYPILWPAWLVASAALFLVLISGLVIWQFRYRPYLFVGWSLFLGTLVPVIGLVQIGSQSMADRYTYIPYIGLFTALTWLAADWSKQRGTITPIIAAGCSVLIGCATLTSKQVSYWSDSATLYRHGISVTEDNFPLEMNLGNVLLDVGRTNEALHHYNVALKINPADALTHGNLARIYAAEGNWELATAHYEEALRFEPNNAWLHNSYGFALKRQGELGRAIEHFETAVKIRPDMTHAVLNLAEVLTREGRIDEAVGALQQSANRDIHNVELQLQLGTVLVNSGRYVEAAPYIKRAVELRPNSARAHFCLGLIDSAEAKSSDAPLMRAAKSEFQQVLSYDPNNGAAHVQLALVAVAEGDLREAIREYRAALKINADWPEALNNLAWILATSNDALLRNGTEAVQLANKACNLVGFRQPMFVGTLAAAYAEAGNFEKAIEMGEAAYQIANSAGQTDIAEKNLQLLKLYRAGHPYWEPDVSGTNR